MYTLSFSVYFLRGMSCHWMLYNEFVLLFSAPFAWCAQSARGLWTIELNKLSWKITCKATLPFAINYCSEKVLENIVGLLVGNAVASQIRSYRSISKVISDWLVVSRSSSSKTSNRRDCQSTKTVVSLSAIVDRTSGGNSAYMHWQHKVLEQWMHVVPLHHQSSST